MILEAMVGLSLVLNVSLDTEAPPAPNPAAWLHMSADRKDAALLPLVRIATDCIIQKVTADPRFNATMRPGEINDLIVDSISACGRPVRAMMDAHDRMYGKGSGEAFLLGPYLTCCRPPSSRRLRHRSASQPMHGARAAAPA
jgi:hypothetical protein